MTKYTEKDIELVLQKYYNQKKILMTSEFLRSKILEFAKECGQDDNYESLYPYTAIWKINSDCNLRCKHCYFYGSEQYSTKHDFSYQEICNVVDMISDLGVSEIRLTGGEVFLQKDIFRILQYIKNKNISVIITTNGTLITEEYADKLYKILSPSADIIRVSLDGASPETHDATRGNGVFNKAFKAIKILKDRGFRVFVVSTISSKNVHELIDLYKILNQINVNQITLTKIVPIDSSQIDLVPSFEDLVYNSAKMYEQIKETDNTIIDNRLFTSYDFLQDKSAKRILYDYALKNKPPKINYECHCNRDKSFYIDADGTVYLCPLASDYKVEPLGNLRKQTLEDLFKNRTKNKLFQKQNRSSMKCKSCTIFSLCNGGCLMKSYIKNKNINSLPC